MLLYACDVGFTSCIMEEGKHVPLGNSRLEREGDAHGESPMSWYPGVTVLVRWSPIRDGSEANMVEIIHALIVDTGWCRTCFGTGGVQFPQIETQSILFFVGITTYIMENRSYWNLNGVITARRKID